MKCHRQHLDTINHPRARLHISPDHCSCFLGFQYDRKWPRGHHQESHAWLCHKTRIRIPPWPWDSEEDLCAWLSPALRCPGLVCSPVPTTLNQTLQEAHAVPRKDPRDRKHTNQRHGHKFTPRTRPPCSRNEAVYYFPSS